MLELKTALVTAVPAPALTAPATELDWANCGVEAQGAKLGVPLDWDRPSGMAVDRHRADPATARE